VTLECVFTGQGSKLESDCTVLVTAKRPVDRLWRDAQARGLAATRAGDCYGPGTIAAAVHAGRNFAESFGPPLRDFLEIPFRREVTGLS
jgi:dimethylamine/trimethylamine dehydrogenase